MTDREVRDLIAAIDELWPAVKVWSADEMVQVRAWNAVLAGIAADEAIHAVIEYARTGAAFPPPPGAIAEVALSNRERAAGTFAPDLDQALAEVRHYTGRGLDAGEPTWSHPAVGAAVRAIGWRELCLSDRPDVIRAQFSKAYEAARARVRGEQRRTPAMRALIGRAPAIETGESNVQ